MPEITESARLIPMDIGTLAMKTAEDLAKLTQAVAVMAETQRHSEKERDEDRLNSRAMLQQLEKLNEKMVDFAGVQSKVGSLAENQAGLRHDINGVKGAQEGMAAVIAEMKRDAIDNAKELVRHETEVATLKDRVVSLQARNIKQDGAVIPLKNMWLILTAIASAATAGVLVHALTPAITTSAIQYSDPHTATMRDK